MVNCHLKQQETRTLERVGSSLKHSILITDSNPAPFHLIHRKMTNNQSQITNNQFWTLGFGIRGASWLLNLVLEPDRIYTADRLIPSK